MVKIFSSLCFSKNNLNINTVKNYYGENNKARFVDSRRINIGHFEEYIISETSLLLVSKELATIDKTDLPVSTEYNSF